MKCPRCDHAAFLRFQTTDLNRQVDHEKFAYYTCSNCKTVFLRPIPPNLGLYYSEGYYAIPNSLSELVSKSERQQFKIELVRKYVASGRLLEIGPSFGGFAYLSKLAGYRVDTIEMDARCCDFLENVVGVRAIHSNNPAISLKLLGQYDVIALWQVIEHLPDPWALLKVIAEHLAPNGIVVIAAPNPSSFQWQLFGRYWVHLDAPRHLQLLPIETLVQDMSQKEMELVYKTTSDPEAAENNAHSWRNSLANLTTQPTMRSALYNVGRILTKVMQPLEHSRLISGDSYTLVFHKQPLVSQSTAAQTH